MEVGNMSKRQQPNNEKYTTEGHPEVFKLNWDETGNKLTELQMGANLTCMAGKLEKQT